MGGSRWPELLVALAALGAAVVPGCGPAPSADAARPLELLVAEEPSTLDPRFSTRSVDMKLTRLVHAGLARLDPDTLRPIPGVAERFEELGPRRLRAVLRPGVRFHSGAPLTPDDVCATLAALASPELGSPHRSVVEAISACATEPNAVVLSLGSDRATVLSDLEVPILRADQAASPASVDGNLDGLGPYSIASATPTEVHLVPARTGLGPEAHRALVVRVVRDENARALRLLAGRADIAPGSISPTLLPALSAQPGLSVVARPGANVTYLLMNNDRPPTSDRAFRRAVAHAIDAEAIVRGLYGGHARVATGMLPPEHWAAAAAPPSELAAAQGEVPTAGRELRLLTSTERARVVVARALAQMLSDAGVPVRVVSLDLGVLLARLDDGDYDLAVLQIPELTEPNVLAWFFHPDGVPGEGGAGRNRVRYRSRRAGELLREAGQIRDEGRRAALYRAWADQVRADVPFLPLWHEDQLAVVSDRAAGFTPSAEGRWLAVTGAGSAK